MGEFSVRSLERGGTLVCEGDFSLQIGAYPETIKDTMAGQGVPSTYLVPESLFDLKAGVSAAELEFPLYYNFFVKRRKLRLICRRAQLRPILRVLSEALFGPRKLTHAQEFVDGPRTPGFPDLEREMCYFKRRPDLPRGRMHLADCIQAVCLDEHGRCQVDGVDIEAMSGDRYRFTRGDATTEVLFEPLAPSPEPPNVPPYQPPVFGVTIIGSGHGFDASSNTSGFIIWINGKGILVDPPVNSTAWLRECGVNTRLIEDIILTHCHADHDSGTLQKILQEGRVTLHTTETVLSSFTRKYRTLAGLSISEFESLFNFSPVQIDQGVNIEGAEFRFKYRLHPIPTIGFETFFQGQSLVYSSDTLYDPDTIVAMHQEGILSKSRTDDLLDFPWYHSLILHEAGMPPIHTPVANLALLPDDVKQRLQLMHISLDAIPPGSGLRLAPPGAANTLILDVPPPDASLAYKTLDLLGHVDLFRSLRIDKAAEFLRITHYSRHSPGEVVIRAGDPGNAFYMILSGEADVFRDGRLIKTFERYDYFGEIAIVANQPRIADIVAKTELEVLYILRYDFLVFIRGTRLPHLFRRVAQNRTRISWNLLDEHAILGHLTPFQRSQLAAIITPRQLEPGQTVYRYGERVSAYALVAEGDVYVEEPTGASVTVSRGAILGRIGRNLELPRHGATATALSPTTLYLMPSDEMVAFFRANPGFYMRVLAELGPQGHGYVPGAG